MILWPLHDYRPLQPGEWRLTCWRTPRPRFARAIDRFPEGNVYRVWCWWLAFKVQTLKLESEESLP